MGGGGAAAPPAPPPARLWEKVWVMKATELRDKLHGTCSSL